MFHSQINSNLFPLSINSLPFSQTHPPNALIYPFSGFYATESSVIASLNYIKNLGIFLPLSYDHSVQQSIILPELAQWPLPRFFILQFSVTIHICNA